MLKYLKLPKLTLVTLKVALQERVGVKKEPLAMSKQLNQHNQGLEEKVKDCASTLKRLLKDAHTLQNH